MTKTDVRGISNPRRAGSIDASVFDLLQNLPLQLVPHRRELRRRALLHAISCQFRRLSQSDYARDILRPRPAGALVPPAVKQRLQARPLLQIKRSNPLRAMKLVTGDGKRVTANPLHADGDLARCLNGVSMKQDAGFGGNLPDLLHRLQHAGLVVGHHDRDQPRIRTQCPLYIGRIDQTALIYRHNCNLAAHLLQVLHRMEHSMMLDAGSNHVIAGLQQSGDGQIVALRPPGSEYDLRCAAVQQFCNRLARALHRGPRLLPVMVNRGCVAELLPKIRAHGLEYFRQNRSGGVIVQVNALHTEPLTLFYVSSSPGKRIAPVMTGEGGSPHISTPGSYRWSMGTYRPGYSGPMYSARGRMRRLSSSCSITWAVQPLMRETANTGVKRSTSMPSVW